MSSDTTSKIRFAVIGAGHIGKRHAEMVRRNAEAELVAICDIRPANQLGELPPVPFFGSATELFSSGIEFDVVCICTPNGLHAELTLLALEYRKHVVIEKPMALSVAGLREKSSLKRFKYPVRSSA